MSVSVTTEEELSLYLAIVCGKRTLLAAWPEPHILCKHSLEYFFFLNRGSAIEDEHISNSGTYDTHWRWVASYLVEIVKYSSSCESYQISGTKNPYFPLLTILWTF